MTNAYEEFVVLGLEDVEHAVDLARELGWSSARAPGAFRRELRVTRGCRVLTHADAEIAVVVTAGPLPCRAAGWWTGDDSIALDHLGLRFRSVLGSSETAESLIARLVRPTPAHSV